ncbi:hypothetical protein C5167_032139 [Papaver somniferum]|uniref:C2H2-type domain-containing protein n=1 Tax=Papaver somniferum TaxID=3469 RepID=A0A4Y7K9L0_PAPSO|nr:hypothetical protein C5167_032139 [Papaver somniferum]
MKVLLQLRNKVPSSYSEEEDSEETYSGSKLGSDYVNSSYSPQYVSSTVGKSGSRLPRWITTGRRGRKGSRPSASASSYNSLTSTEKEEEPPFGEMEAAEALLMLSKGLSLDETRKLQTQTDSIVKFPEYNLIKKRKIEDSGVGYAEDRLKIARVDKETNNYRDEFSMDTMTKKNVEAIHKVPMVSSASGNFSCHNCGKSFGCYQALGGHKSSCNSNYLKSEGGESAPQGSMRKTNNESSKDLANSGPHQCKFCAESFSTGQALGGHQRRHKREPVEPHVSRSSVSPPKNISGDCPTNSLTSVQEAAEENITSKKIIMLDLNEDPPMEKDDVYIDLQCPKQLKLSLDFF